MPLFCLLEFVNMSQQFYSSSSQEVPQAHYKESVANETLKINWYLVTIFYLLECVKISHQIGSFSSQEMQ